jgi:hypothetical protein
MILMIVHKNLAVFSLRAKALMGFRGLVKGVS